MSDEFVWTKSGSALLPDPLEMFIRVPLYYEFNHYSSHHDALWELEFFDGTIDAYCVECQRDSVFQGQRGSYRELSSYDHTRTRDFDLTLRCTRDNSHKMMFFFRVDNSKLSKVGQYPSLADLHEYDIRKYRKVLGEQRYREFARAVGLFAHGIGIGSFVYLRRIFEDLIERAHQEATQSEGWDEEAFSRRRVDERIKLLRDWLPEVMVQNASIYSILSRGIHELTEDECREYFGTIKAGIELILDDEIARQQRERKSKEITDKIGQIKGELGSGSSS